LFSQNFIKSFESSLLILNEHCDESFCSDLTLIKLVFCKTFYVAYPILVMQKPLASNILFSYKINAKKLTSCTVFL